MRSFVARGALSFCVLSMALGVTGAQQTSTDTFDDLARRAEGVLDSRPAEAAELYRQALALRGDWAEGWFYLGGALYQTDRYAEATDALRKAVALTPDNGRAWAFLGLSEAELDSTEQALADIRKGEQLGLGDNLGFEIAVRFKAAQILIRSSSFDEAFGELQPLLKKGEVPQPVVDTVGLCVLATPAKLSELSEERRAVVRLAGTAAAAAATQHPEQAATAYRQLVEQYPDEPGVHYAYGLYLMETDAAVALAEFQREVQINPKNWPAQVMVSNLSIRQGAPDAAIRAIREAMKIVPAKYRWLCHADLGRANLIADNLETAVTELQTAVKLMPANAQLRFFLAQALRRSGRTEDAQRETAEFQRLKTQEDPLGVATMRPFSLTGKN
jgi:tetratricopeptide (TPR) repeat protein